jgi:hypothetical protein
MEPTVCQIGLYVSKKPSASSFSVEVDNTLPNKMMGGFGLESHEPWDHALDAKQTNKRPKSMRELYQPSDLRLSAKLVPTLADKGVSRSQMANPLRL